MNKKPYINQIFEDDPLAIEEYLTEDQDCESFPEDREVVVNDLLDEYDRWSEDF